MFIFLTIVLAFSISTCEAKTHQEAKNKMTTEEIKNSTDETIDETMKEEKPKPQLEVSISLEKDTLRVHYKVKNTTDLSIYLFNVFWDVDETGKEVRAKEQLHVCLREDKVLSLSKRIAPLPKWKLVEWRIVPYVTKVEPGKEFEESIELKQPIEEYNPYFPKEPDSETEVRLAERVVFSLDYIHEMEGLEIKTTDIENAFSVWHEKLLAEVKTLTSKEYSMIVKVNYRKDDFERF